MTTERVKRKLSAIFSADVEGYSRLMGEDEVATVRTLENYREVMTDLILQHRGRVIDSPGDNLLAEFPSVVDAVQCAVEVQQLLKAKNAEMPEERRMQFRIGVNLGDVIEEGDRIYGDGVNIAARVESLAEGGGICISGSAYEQIENKLALGYEDLGQHIVKNIAKPIQVYRVPMEPRVRIEKRVRLRRWQWAALAAVVILIIGAVAIWNSYFRPPPIEPASIEKMAYPLPDKPSIAVLPFVNLSGDPEQDSFSDGLTEEIITALSKIAGMFVIARNSTYTYKGKPVKVQRVAEELGVQYVLEGTVRKAGDRLRITAQLIDALTGHHLWAERYERDLSMKSLFEIQDGITIQVLKALQIYVTKVDDADFRRRGRTDNLEAYLKIMKAADIGWGTLELAMKARPLIEEAIALDPDYGEAYRELAWNYICEARYGGEVTKSYERGVEAAKKAISLDGTNSYAYQMLAHSYFGLGLKEKAKATWERGMSIDPNNDRLFSSYAWNILRSEKRYEEAISYIEKAKRLNPIPQWYYYVYAGILYMDVRNYEKAIQEWKQYIKESQRIGRPLEFYAYNNLTHCFLILGREEEAYAAATELLKINPKYPLKNALGTAELQNNAAKARLLDALHKTGLLQKEEEVPVSTAMKWNSNADGVGKDGVFTRKNPPAFSFEYPADLVIQHLLPYDIFRIKDPSGSLPDINVGVGKITGEFNQFMQEYEVEFKRALANQGRDFKTIYNKPLPPEIYGEDYPAQELSITWRYGGGITVRSYVDVIAKGEYYIAMQVHTSGETVGSIDRVKAIFKTIDLEP